MTRIDNLERVTELVGADYLLQKYPGRVPLIVVCHQSCPPDIKRERQRYLVPRELQFGCIQGIIRKKIQLDHIKSLFVFCNNSLVPLNQTISQVYDKYVSEDGFLYVYYTLENTFG